jgi:cytochrome c oxidase subunit 6a
MASRALFNTQFTSSLKRAGVRYSSSSAENDFVAQRNAVKHHAAGKFI